MSTIETRVDGSPASVNAAGLWLRESAKKALADAGDDVVSARSHAMSGFEGRSGEAYVEADRAILTQVDGHADRLGEAAAVFEAYGARLRQMQDRMAEIRGAATAGGLSVSGTVIHAPPPAVAPPSLYGPVTEEQRASHERGVDAYHAAAGKVELYNRLAGDVQLESTSFTDWVDTHVTLLVETFDVPAVEALLGVVTDNLASFTIGFSTETGQRALSRISDRLQGEAEDLRSARRSGNPARRALGEAPETPGRIADLMESSKWLSRGGKLLGPAGVVIDSYGALEGDKPGGGLIAVAAGTAATAGVIAYVAAAPVTVPTTLVIAGGVAVGIGVSWAVNEGWDALPDSITDPVDDFVDGAWEGGKDLASDGWNEVKSWF